MPGLSWNWIAIASVVPPIGALVLALPFWRMRQPIFGNIIGSIIIFGCSLAFIMREHVELDRITQACLDKGDLCWPDPSAFARFAIYAFIGLIEVIALFLLSLNVETRISRQGYAPEWR